MTTRLASRPVSDQATANGPTALRLASTGRKRAIGTAIGAGLLIITCALVFGATFVRSGQRESVIVTNKPIASGQIIRSDDLRVARVSADDSIRPISSARMSSVVGRPAAVSLAPGMLLTESVIGASSELSKADAVVGLSLKVGQYPSELAAGATVRVVGTDTAQSSTLVEAATVMSVGAPDASHSDAAAVSLKVPSALANSVVAAASAGKASLVVVAAS